MKKIFLGLIILLILIMIYYYNKTSNIEVVRCKGIKGESVSIYFLNTKVGYSFNNITFTDWDNITEEQLDDPNFHSQSIDSASIFKTIDGGENWKEITSIQNYRFYNTILFTKHNFYIQIIDSKINLVNRILKFDTKNNVATLVNYNFERMGEMWTINENFYINSINNNINYIFKINNTFDKIDSIREQKIFKNKIISLDKEPYVVTWDNDIYNINKKTITKINSLDIECISKIDDFKILIAGNNRKNKNQVILESYNLNTKEIEKIKKFDGYSIVKDLHSNNKVICGFIGNIEGIFTAYDLFYSTDKGKTWKIQKLKERNAIHQSSLVDNILFTSGLGGIQKITLN